MCTCDPDIGLPFCGRGRCQWPVEPPLLQTLPTRTIKLLEAMCAEMGAEDAAWYDSAKGLVEEWKEWKRRNHG